MNVDLSLLPVPDLVETLDFEEEYQGVLGRFRLAMGDQWSAVLESDPVVKLMEEMAYERVITRARINDAARSVLLASARGADLDNVLAFMDAKRLTAERDDDYRERGRQAPYGFSTAGPLAAYKYHAKSAHSDVLDAKVDRPEPGVVRITVLSRSPGGVPSEAVLAAVRTALSADDIRPLTDTLLVVAATVVRYVVKGRIYVASGAAPEPLLEAAKAATKLYTDQQFAIGEAVTPSGLYAALHQPGASRADLLSPVTGIAAQAQTAALCTGIELEVVTNYV